MAFDFIQSLKVITPKMIWRGLMYPYRSARNALRTTRSDLRGLALLRETSRRVQQGAQYDQYPLKSYLSQGAVQSIEQEEHSLELQTAEGAFRIRPLADDLLQIRARPSGQFPDADSYGIEKPEHAWTRVAYSLNETEDRIGFSTQAMRLVIDKNPLRFSLETEAGQPLLREIQGVSYHPADGRIAWQVEVDPDAAIYGLGEKTSALNLAGKQFELWNIDPAGYNRGDDPIYMSIPFIIILSQEGAVGVFLDNSYRAWIDLGADRPGRITYRTAGGEFRVYLMSGTPESILKRYTELTGRTKLPPLWSLGYHQCRWSYYPEARVLELAREFRERALPCDAIHLDIHYMYGYRCFTWDTSRFPNRREMITDLHDKGFKVLTMIDPGIKVDRGYRVHDEGVKRGAFLAYPDGRLFKGPVWPGDCYFPDFANPEVRRWWGGLYRGLLEDGVDAFWNDMNEIGLITLKPHETNFVPDEVVHTDEHGEQRQHAELHNVYGMLMTKASSEGLQNLHPDRRPMLLTRSGWAGIQRYAMHWTADNASTWDHLLLSIQMVLNLGFSGVPLTGPDVGGFSGTPSPELFARWMQVGALTPFFRVHSMLGTPDQEPWSFGAEAEAISRKYLELRYRLLPYIYTVVWQAAQTGMPAARAMSLMYPGDPQTYNLDDQYFFGDSLLVAPVVTEGAIKREVYLPEGTWFNYWTDERHTGGRRVQIDAPLDTLPLFVRGGAVIPHWPVQQYVGERVIDTVDLNVYPVMGEYASLLYEDDGLRTDYESAEAHRLSHFELFSEGPIRLSRRIKSGSYQPPAKRLRINVVQAGEERAASVSGGSLLSQHYDAAENRQQLEIETGGEFDLELN